MSDIPMALELELWYTTLCHDPDSMDQDKLKRLETIVRSLMKCLKSYGCDMVMVKGHGCTYIAKSLEYMLNRSPQYKRFFSSNNPRQMLEQLNKFGVTVEDLESLEYVSEQDINIKVGKIWNKMKEHSHHIRGRGNSWKKILKATALFMAIAAVALAPRSRQEGQDPPWRSFNKHEVDMVPHPSRGQWESDVISSATIDSYPTVPHAKYKEGFGKQTNVHELTRPEVKADIMKSIRFFDSKLQPGFDRFINSEFTISPSQDGSYLGITGDVEIYKNYNKLKNGMIGDVLHEMSHKIFNQKKAFLLRVKDPYIIRDSLSYILNSDGNDYEEIKNVQDWFIEELRKYRDILKTKSSKKALEIVMSSPDYLKDTPMLKIIQAWRVFDLYCNAKIEGFLAGKHVRLDHNGMTNKEKSNQHLYISKNPDEYWAVSSEIWLGFNYRMHWEEDISSGIRLKTKMTEYSYKQLIENDPNMASLLQQVFGNPVIV
jgi:hypothetical protein